MNYITTNIRIPEKDYERLKREALAQKKSFAQIIRQKIGVEESIEEREAAVKQIEITRQKLGKYFEGFDIVEFLRKDRYEGHKINNY